MAAADSKLNEGDDMAIGFSQEYGTSIFLAGSTFFKALSHFEVGALFVVYK
jgi:hypothetical protein